MFKIFFSSVRGLGVVIVAVILALLAVPAAAQAHGGPFSLNIAPDGAGGLVVSAVYSEDGHAVTEVIDPTATAVGDDGSTIGPVALISSAEGEGIWVTAEPFLPVGTWTVTVSTSMPSVATATTTVTVAELAGPEEEVVENVAAPDDAAADANTEAAAEAASPLTPWLWAGAGVVFVGLLAVIVYRFRSGRRRPQLSDEG